MLTSGALAGHGRWPCVLRG